MWTLPYISTRPYIAADATVPYIFAWPHIFAPPPYIALVPLMPHTLRSVLSLQSSLTLMQAPLCKHQVALSDQVSSILTRI